MKVIYYTILIILFAAGSALAASGSIEYVNRWPEISPNVITGDGSYIYHGDGEVISVYDAADLTLVSRVTIPLTTAANLSDEEVAGTEGISGVFYDNGYLYVTCGSEGLRIYEVPADLADMANVTPVSYPVVENGQRVSVKDVCVQDDYAYLAYFWLTPDGYDSGLHIVDVSDPTNPVFVGDGQLSSSFAEIKKAQSIVVSDDGNYVYIADMFNGLGVFDVSDPANPEIEAYSYMASALDVAVSGDYAYLACAGSGINVVNVADTNFTDNVDSLNIVAFSDYAVASTRAAAVEVSGDSVYVGDLANGLVILDNSDPEAISDTSVRGSYETDLRGVYRIYVDTTAGMAYAGDSIAGLVQIDVGDPQNPALSHFTDDTGTPADVDALDIDVTTSYVYVVDDDATDGTFQEGLRILFAVESENYITFLYKGGLTTQGEARDVVMAGDYVYIADGSDGLKIVDPGLPPADADGNRDTEKPVAPVLLGGYDAADGFNGDATGVFVENGYAYVAARDGGVQVLDVFPNAADPVLVGTNNTDMTDARAVFVENDLAYVADGANGLKIVDVSDKSAPVLRGEFEIPDSDDEDTVPGTAHDISKVGNLLYIAAGDEGFQVVDVSDPDNPYYYGDKYTAEPYRQVKGIYAARSDENDAVDLVWVANGYASDSMGFFTNPDTTPPQRIVAYQSYGNTRDVISIGDFAYIADSGGGIQALGVQQSDDELGDWYYDVTPVDLHDSSDSGGCFIDSVFAPVTNILSRGW